MTTRIVTDANGRKHITNEPLLHPPQRTWVGLTNEEANQILSNDEMNLIQKLCVIEAKLKEKNT